MADKMQENITKLETEMQRQESFMGSFAHELKTPMTSIIGFSDLLRQGNLDENTRMMAAEYIHSESRRLERLSFKLLDLILLKKDGLAMKRVPLNAFLAEIERAMAPVMKNKNIRLVCRADHHRVILEPDLVKSLVYNLIDNASKAIEGEGIIAVKATAIPAAARSRWWITDGAWRLIS
jgi:signal transduction histidine kinase